MTRERIAGLGLVALLAATLMIAGVRVARSWEQMRPRISGDPAPAFALPAITASGALGERVSLEDMRGKVLIVDFWATWCGPCRASMPRLESVARRFAGEGVALVSINTEGRSKAATARKMLDRLSPSGVLLSDGGAVADAYGVTTIPHLALISRDGTIRWVHRGGLGGRAEKNLISEIEDLL